MDKMDSAILMLLQKDCKLTVREISVITKSPMTTVFAKMKKLEKAGIIKYYKAVLNSEKLGRGTTGFMLISVSRATLARAKDVAEELARLPEVQEVHLLAGDWDIMIKLKIKDVGELAKFLSNRVKSAKEIERTLTCAVLETLKETMDIDIDIRESLA